MKRLQSRPLACAAVIVLALAAAACSAPDPDGQPDGSVPDLPGEPLTEAELIDLGPRLASAARKVTHAIPADRLDPEDIDMENDVVVELLDAEGARVGWLRDIFTHVSCSGACHAVHFVLLFDPECGFLDVYTPTGDEFAFMKYWEGEHVPFTTDDLARLVTLLQSPPQSLIDVEDSQTLVVEATVTAATEPAYHDVVVRGAAFSTWTVLHYMLETQAFVREALIGGTP